MTTTSPFDLIRDVGTLTCAEIDQIACWLGPGLFGHISYEIAVNPALKDIAFIRMHKGTGYQLATQ